MLPAKHVRRNPALYGLLIELKCVPAQTETGMQEFLILLGRSIKIPDQRQQALPVDVRELCLNICPRWTRFRRSPVHAASILQPSRTGSGRTHEEVKLVWRHGRKLLDQRARLATARLDHYRNPRPEGIHHPRPSLKEKTICSAIQ